MQRVMQPCMDVRQDEGPRLPLLQHAGSRQQLRHPAEPPEG